MQKMQAAGAKGYEATKKRALEISEKDQEVWKIMTDVPLLPSFWPYICFVLNLFISGTGTMIASCVG